MSKYEFKRLISNYFLQINSENFFKGISLANEPWKKHSWGIDFQQVENRNMLNFDFLGKGLEIVSPSHLTMIFFQKKISHVMLF